jgi:exonuclease SbcC
MKILAIRGKNLASLSSEFCVDFQAEPLSSAGLYAITGPTGSGKSTLLDALCLALYEKTPRLTRAGARGEKIPDVGDSSIGPADARTILRRGANEGFAEVDFVGSDGIPYRARWSVRRARNRAVGNLQPSEITLLRLTDNQALGDHTKTETLKLIESCIGLNFDQFTRAVLLAQNDFALFLKSSDDDRAELLQTLTGTNTFTLISMQSFARAKAENEELNRIDQQLADQAPMADETRAVRVMESAAQDALVNVIEQQKAASEGHLRWCRQWTQIQASEAEATSKLDQANAAKAQASDRVGQLSRIEAVQPARALRAEADRLQHEATRGASTLKESEAQLTQATKVAGERKQQLAMANGQLQITEKARAEAQPRIDQARALDALIAALAPACQAAVKSRDDAKQALGQEEARHTQLQQDHTQARTSLQTCERWLDAHPQLRPLADGWLRWETLLELSSSQLGEHRKTAGEVAQLTTTEGALKTSIEKARAGHAAHISEYKAAADKLAALIKALAAFNPDEMARSRQTLEIHRDHLASAAQLWRTISEQQQRLQQWEVEKQTHIATLDQLDTQLRQLAAEKPAAEQELAGAEKSQRIAELAASKSVEQMRATLETDSPCPVCGSTTHPYAEHNPQLESVLKGLREERDRALKILTGIAERTAAEAARKQGLQKQLAQLEKDIAVAMAVLQTTRQQWVDHPLSGEIASAAEVDRVAWLSERQVTLKSDLDLLGKKEAGYREAVRQRDAVQEVVTKVKSTMDTAQSKVSELDLEYQKTEQFRQTAQHRLSGIEQKMQVAQADLDAAFPDLGWREVWMANPDGFVSQCRSEVEAWKQQQKQVVDLISQINSLAAAIVAAGEACDKAARHFKTQTDQCAHHEDDLHAKQANRQTLFDGKPIAEVEAELNSAIETAKSGAAQLLADSQKADADHARLNEAVRQTQGQLEKNQAALESASQKLDTWLQAFDAGRGADSSLSMDGLKALLAFEPEWIVSERLALQALANDIATAEAVLREYRKARTEHEAGKPSDDSVDVIQEAITRISAELEAAKELHASLKLELAQDEARRQKSLSLMAEIEKQAAKTRVWSQLSDLIGSADGKKFRNFAQQLTLDILLGYANRHLESLSRRYRLERIKDSLGLLVVDQDMGDEVRSVHSLSGGESFLVSLSLALGLASLSSHRVRVESLFIDEGFGSLDADSLRIAIEALDNLQAQGRKVGVISHVQEMTERIGTRIQVNRLAGGQSRVVVT